MAHDFKAFPELRNNQMELYYWESPHKQIFEDIFAKVIRVKDGDTVQVRWQERDFDFPVRLVDIQAPELKEGGLESGQWLRQRIEGQEVDILVNPKNRVGRWGRLIGDIIHGGESMSEASIREGHSVPFEVEAVI